MNKPTTAYIGATWSVLLIGVLAYLFGLWNAETLQLNEKGYYFTVLAFGLYAAISLQKTVRDQAEDIPTSRLYYLISWLALGTAVSLVIVGLFNATALTLSEKGFYLMAYTMSVYAAITVQKNIRDLANYNVDNELTTITHEPSSELEQTNSRSERQKSISNRVFRSKE